MAPLISLRQFFDVLTLTDEFTANIVLFHLMSASHAFLRTFRADGRLDNGFNPIFGICVCAYICVCCAPIINNIYRVNSDIKYIREDYNVHSCIGCVALYFSSTINYVDKIFLRDRIIVILWAMLYQGPQYIKVIVLLFKTRLIVLTQTRCFSSSCDIWRVIHFIM